MCDIHSTHQSRFGFHPCDLETYRKLRSLKRYYWLTVRDFHRWWRWQRKQAQNRQGPEPAYCSVFVENRPWIRWRRVHGHDAVRHYPRTLVDRGVLGWFAAAKPPQAEPPPLFDAATLEQIDQLHAEAFAWFNRS